MFEDFEHLEHTPTKIIKKDNVNILNDITLGLDGDATIQSIPIDIDFNVDAIIKDLHDMVPLAEILAKIPLSIKGSITLNMSYSD